MIPTNDGLKEDSFNSALVVNILLTLGAPRVMVVFLCGYVCCYFNCYASTLFIGWKQGAIMKRVNFTTCLSQKLWQHLLVILAFLAL